MDEWKQQKLCAAISETKLTKHFPFLSFSVCCSIRLSSRMIRQFATSLSMRNASPTSSRRAPESRLAWSRIRWRIAGPSPLTISDGFATFVGNDWTRRPPFIAWVSQRWLWLTGDGRWTSPLCPFSVCEYYAHIECQDFAIADCKENATYVPGKELGSVKHIHHWREGNLPQSSKCAYCKKTCWSSECLTGERWRHDRPDFSLLNFAPFHFRISLRVVWIYFARRLSSLRHSRVHVRNVPAYLLAAARRLDTANWSANGSNNWCPSEEQRSSHDTRVLMP